VAFVDEAFAITSAISKPAAVPMYNDERATDAKTRSKQALAVGHELVYVFVFMSS
jgi:hypothetical protein